MFLISFFCFFSCARTHFIICLTLIIFVIHIVSVYRKEFAISYYIDNKLNELKEKTVRLYLIFTERVRYRLGK